MAADLPPKLEHLEGDARQWLERAEHNPRGSDAYIGRAIVIAIFALARELRAVGGIIQKAEHDRQNGE